MLLSLVAHKGIIKMAHKGISGLCVLGTFMCNMYIGICVCVCTVYVYIYVHVYVYVCVHVDINK